MHYMCKYLLYSTIIALCCLQKYCLSQTTTVRPYKFGFTIDQQQHRSEQRDERGIVMGEFGFITADGIYHVTVYATDEQGRFRILAMKNYPYESPPKTVEVMVKPKIPIKTTTTPKPLTRHNFNTEACSGCFLSNGNNKPKDINGIQAKTMKNDIRPLSKPLPSETNTPAVPKLSNQPSSENHLESKTNNTPNNLSQNLQTEATSQENTLQNTPLANSFQPEKETRQLSSPQTYNTNSGHIETRTLSRDANQQQTSRPTTSKTATGNSNPPIMDIIMQKVLPTLMGSKGATPTTHNKKSNVPSGRKPSTNSDTDSSRVVGSSGNSNDSNDFYRFKYILDYNGHSETGKRNGNKEGTYYSIGDDNVERTIEYVANEFGYQPRIRWRKLDSNEIKSKENTLKDYEFVWFN